VTPDALTDRLLAAGFEPDDAAARAALCLRAATALARHAGRPARWGWFVPGRIEVFGKHTDYAGGRSLVAAVPRGFAVAASPRDDGIVSVVDARWRDAVDVDPLDDTRTFKGWTNYVAVVARRLADNFRGAPLGADLVIASDLPRAAGLSSSSALVVGLALALIRRAALDAAPAWRASIRSGFDLGGYLGAVENGLTFGGLAGTGGVGTHGGSQDHNAILNGRPGQVSAYAYLPVRHLADAALPADWRFIVLSSGIRADKAGSVRARYNRASLATRALVELGQRLGPAPEAGASGAGPATLAAMLTEPGRVEALASLAAAGHGAFTGEELTRRLRHFVAEDGRVLPAADAVRRRDAAVGGGGGGPPRLAARCRPAARQPDRRDAPARRARARQRRVRGEQLRRRVRRQRLGARAPRRGCRGRRALAARLSPGLSGNRGRRVVHHSTVPGRRGALRGGVTPWLRRSGG
jgi:galactokinase